MAKTNYQMIRRKKEAERKTRRDDKLARRSVKGSGDPANASDQSPTESATLPSKNAPE